MEVDGVVSQALRGLVALATATLKRFPHPDLCAVAILGVVLDTIHILERPGRGNSLNYIKRHSIVPTILSSQFPCKHPNFDLFNDTNLL